MAIFDLFSKRQKRLRGEVPDVYQYEKIPGSFRVQIVQIVDETFGKDKSAYSKRCAAKAFKFIHETLCKEYGVFTLNKHSVSDYEAIYNYFLACNDYEQTIDIIELSFQVINTQVRAEVYQDFTENKKLDPDEAIKELNVRFRENGVGYQFESNEIIRMDSQILHSEVVKPTLKLLGNEKRFKGANEEFLNAHLHFRNGLNKECLVDTLKAFESVMKAICQKQGWLYKQTDTAKTLIDECLKNNLIPTYLQSQFSSLRNLLESGVPTVRNKLAGHGQGTKKITVTDPIASYALHLTATNILFLVGMESENFN